MASPSKVHYLEGKILTASQPQLQLMLLEGALRFGRQARELWEGEAEFAEIERQLMRMADVVEELTHGAAQGETEISKQLEEQYAFVYRSLTQCRINQELKILDACLNLLEYQRETWKRVCKRLESTVSTSKPGLPHLKTESLQVDSGLSLEA